MQVETYPVEINVGPQFWVFFDIVHEHLHVAVTIILVAFLGLALMNIILTLLLEIQVLELPDALLLSLADLRKALADNHNVWEVVGLVVISFQVSHGDLVQVVSKHSVIVIDKLSKMSVDDERLIIVAVVILASDLDLDHLKLVLGCCPRSRHVKVYVVDADDDEFC